MKPNFLIIGAPKCATTSLSENLRKHPEIFMCRPKEPFFFDRDEIYARGWAWYESLFQGVNEEKAIGEATTTYSSMEAFPNAIPRIIKHLPDASIIYVTRHPLERIRSNWVEFLSQGLTTQPFNLAVRSIPHFIDASQYHKQLQGYLAHFPKTKILILFYEEYRKRPQRVLRKCFEFLGVDSSIHIEGAGQVVYASAGKRRDFAATNFLRRNMPGFEKIRNIAPEPVRAVAKGLLKREIKQKPEWDETIKKWAISLIEPDMKNFLEYCGKPLDYWILD